MLPHLVLRVLEHDWEGQAGVLQPLQRAVHQGLVQVDHQRELGTRARLERQRGVAAPHLRRQRRQVLDEDVRVELLPLVRGGLRLADGAVVAGLVAGLGAGGGGGVGGRRVHEVGRGRGQTLGLRVQLQLLHGLRGHAGPLQHGEEGDGLLGAGVHPVLVDVGHHGAVSLGNSG